MRSREGPNCAITPHHGIIQTRIVILIAILALARKIIILDLSTLSAAAMGGLAALTLGLGIAHWTMIRWGFVDGGLKLTRG